jgi:hypothetical protein
VNLQQAARLLGSGQFRDDFTVVVLEGATKNNGIDYPRP